MSPPRGRLRFLRCGVSRVRGFAIFGDTKWEGEFKSTLVIDTDG